VTIFDSGTEQWRYENEYPLARTEWTKFHLRANPAGPASKPPYGRLDTAPAGNEEADSYMSPEAIGLVAQGKPVLAYATPPLERDLRLWGPLSAVLYGAANTLDTEWFVKLMDVDPGGNATQISQGHLKASFREVDKAKSRTGQPYHPFRNPDYPQPDKVYEYQIEMLPIFHTISAGHQMRVQIASEDFVYCEHLRTLNIVQKLPMPARNTVYHDPKHPSHLLLPVIPDAPAIKPVASPVADIKWPL